MSAFIYVFDEAARDKLIAAGYTLLKHSDGNNIYIFANDCNKKYYSMLTEGYILSDSILF